MSRRRHNHQEVSTVYTCSNRIEIMLARPSRGRDSTFVSKLRDKLRMSPNNEPSTRANLVRHPMCSLEANAVVRFRWFGSCTGLPPRAQDNGFL